MFITVLVSVVSFIAGLAIYDFSRYVKKSNAKLLKSGKFTVLNSNI